jgi:hypothetical protein
MKFFWSTRRVTFSLIDAGSRYARPMLMYTDSGGVDHLDGGIMGSGLLFLDEGP